MSRLQGYETVAERLVRFWEANPEGRIRTEVMPHGDTVERWVIRATIWRHLLDPEPSATGWAEEFVGSTPVNKTSCLENCETSAVGRALANLGMVGTDKERATREEMAKVERMKAEPVPTAEESLARIDAAAASIGKDRAYVTERYRTRLGIALEDLPMLPAHDLALLARGVESRAKDAK
jgi:hypothetical protein